MMGRRKPGTTRNLIQAEGARRAARRRALGCAVAVLLGAVVAGCGSGGVAKPVRIRLVSLDPAGQLLARTATGTHPRTLGVAAAALVSPDGAAVAALVKHAGSGASLVLYRTAGRKRAPHLLAHLPASAWLPGSIKLLAWSPDSRLVALSATAVSGAGEQDELVVANRDGGPLRTIATGVFLGASFAPTLPDRLVYARASVDQLDAGEVVLFTADADGSHRRAITRSGLNAAPVWGAKGIVFARLWRVGTQTRSPRYQLWIVQPDGTGLRLLTHIVAGAPAVGAAVAPLSISASGTRVVADFSSPFTAFAAVDVWTINLAHKRPVARRLTFGGQQFIAQAISRSGATILLSSGDGGRRPAALESLRWGATQPQTLLAAAADPSWNR